MSSAPARQGAEAEALLAAMTEVAASHGYAGASVARVLAHAGVSRRAFYRHFSNREDCFIAAYRAAAATVGARLSEAIGPSAPAGRPRATLAALLRLAEEEPAVTRVFLLEAPGACTAVRGEHERLLLGAERSIERFLRRPDAPALDLPASALLGGVCGALAARLLSAGAGEDRDLLTDLLAWLRSYERSHCGARGAIQDGPLPELGSPVGDRHPGMTLREVELLPRGRSALPRSTADTVRRARILAATVRQTAAKGYAALTVTDIVADARIPRAAFYAHFAGKEEAFLAAQTLGLRESTSAAAAEFVTGRSWPEKVWLGLAALLGYLAAHSSLARLCLLETPAAGEAAMRQALDNRGAYGIFLAEGYRQRPGGTRLPLLCSEAIVSAIETIARRYVVRGRIERIEEALPSCAYVALAPFIGPERASDWVSERVRAAD